MNQQKVACIRNNSTRFVYFLNFVYHFFGLVSPSESVNERNEIFILRRFASQQFLFKCFFSDCHTSCQVQKTVVILSSKWSNQDLKERFWCLRTKKMKKSFPLMKQVTSRSSKNPGLDKSNFPQNSNFGREFVQKSGVQIPVREGQFFCPFFFFFSFSY